MGGPDQDDAPKPSAQSHQVAVGARGDPAGVDVAGMRDECPAWYHVADLPPVDGAGGLRALAGVVRRAGVGGPVGGASGVGGPVGGASGVGGPVGFGLPRLVEQPRHNRAQRPRPRGVERPCYHSRPDRHVAVTARSAGMRPAAPADGGGPTSRAVRRTGRGAGRRSECRRLRP